MRSAESFPGDGEKGRGALKEPQTSDSGKLLGSVPVGSSCAGRTSLKMRRLLHEGWKTLPVRLEELGDTFTL